MRRLAGSSLVFALLGLLLVQALWAGGLMDRDASRLERARDGHLKEVEKAFDVYATRVERANKTLQRIYEPIIERYERLGEQETADALKDELESLLTGALKMPFPDEEGEATEGGHEKLINAIGPEVVSASGQRGATAGLVNYDYVVLYFTAGWCAPCRSFTPQVKQFYQRYRSLGNWEVVVVSGDRSERDFYEYLNSAGMPWAAVPYNRIDPSGLKQAFPGGWPRLYVLDREGNTVLSERGANPAVFAKIQAMLESE